MYRKNAWQKYKENNSELMNFSSDYINFLSNCKTERECVKFFINELKNNGFKDIDEVNSLKPGDKVYATNKNKNIAAFVVGEEALNEGINILGAHIDSPRIDLKQNPIYDSNNFAYFDTHYYGGIVKYQWVTIPLALHGVVVKKNGDVLNINIGEDESDPVIGITDLLPHLAADKNAKPAKDVIDGESLDITIGHMPIFEEDKSDVKKAIKALLKDKYDIEDEDFISAEIEVTPAGKARDFGLDKSMILGYGHDDRVCAYTSFRALLDSKSKYTTCVYLVDKEEIGSVGSTGARSIWIKNVFAKMLELESGYSQVKFDTMLSNSRMLSSDVSVGYDPLYASAFEKENTSYLGYGFCLLKYTGARGKSGCNDANAEFIGQIRNILDDNNIYYQTSEIGKVDKGGGGTIAYIMGNMNINVIDAGVAVLSMHAPYEIVSKVDVYETYNAYKVFLSNIDKIKY